MLIGWSVLLLPMVLLAWHIHLHSGQYEWREDPTALGDDHYYKALGPEDDRYAPNLRWKGQDQGIYRRSLLPVALPDEGMRKVAQESTGRFFVYACQGGPLPVVYYLKMGPDAYVEFGDHLHYAPFVPQASEERSGAVPQ